jgi:tetratricopeptide (TPR) repeat protein
VTLVTGGLAETGLEDLLRSRLLVTRGLSHQALGQADEAISALTQAIAAQPANARLHLLRAIACQQAGQLDRAQDGLWRALAIDPSLGEARRRLGEIARAQADNKKPPGP